MLDKKFVAEVCILFTHISFMSHENVADILFLNSFEPDEAKLCFEQIISDELFCQEEPYDYPSSSLFLLIKES